MPQTMTPQELRDLDARIAEKIGWKPNPLRSLDMTGKPMPGADAVPAFSTDPVASAQLEDWLADNGWWMSWAVDWGQLWCHIGKADGSANVSDFIQLDRTEFVKSSARILALALAVDRLQVTQEPQQ